MGKSWKNWKLCLASQIDICGDDGMGYIALGDLISKAQVEKCGKREYPVLSMTMHDGIVFQNDRFKKDIASIDRSNYSIVGFNQLVVSFPIDEGVLAVQDITDAGIVSPAYKIWDIDQAKLVPKYLEMWLRSPRSIDYYKSKLRGTTARRRSIPEEDFLGMRVNVPPKEEQERIVNLLTRVKGVILLREQQLSALDDLIKARFIEMFEGKGYPTLAWNDVFNTTTGKLDSNAMVEDGAYPFFTCAKEVLRIDKYAFDQEALLLAGNNAAGKYDVKYYKGKFNAYQRTYVLGLIQEWSYRLFQYQLEDKLDFLQQQSLGGLTKYLTLKILGALDFIVPPMKFQEEFETFVTQVDKSKSVIQKSLDETQLLFDSLMQKYFE